jgi:hypothetical protein
MSRSEDVTTENARETIPGPYGPSIIRHVSAAHAAEGSGIGAALREVPAGQRH